VSQALQLPRLTSSETQALAALTTQGSGRPITLPQGQQALLQLSPLPPGQAPLQATDTQRLHVEWAGGQMVLDLATASLDAWVHMVLGVATLSQLPESFRPAALEHVIQWLTSALEQAGRGPAFLQTVASATPGRPADAPHALALELRPESGPALSGMLYMDSLALMLVGSLAQSAPAAGQDLDLDSLPVTLNLCVGQTSLPLRQLQSLQVGGLVFMSQSHVQDDGQGLMLSTAIGPRRHWNAQARLQDGQIFVTSNPITMSTIADPRSESVDDPVALDDMPVHLTFDVGQKVMTLAQLRQLGEGQALSLDRDIQSAVSIRANGAVIGQGQLVDIDGRLGVLVHRLHAPSSDKAE
jgi:type III secretion protein Q